MLHSGIDLVAHLNLAAPRDFLLRVEDDLDAFAAASAADESAGLKFPPLAQPFQDLLLVTTCRHGLKTSMQEDRRHRSYVLVTKPASTSAGCHLPLFSYADFMRVQRPPSASDTQGAIQDIVTWKSLQDSSATAAADSSAYHLRRMRLRLWALSLIKDEEGDAAAGPASQSADDELCAAGLQEALDRAFKAPSATKRSDCSSDVSESRPSTTKKRGRGFGDSVVAGKAPQRTRHCYRRFGPKVARRLYLRDDFVHAPWPTAKLRRVAEPGVVWRSEWRVGPMADEAEVEQGVFGGILSWAVQPDDFAFGEGFEVSLRSGPGPQTAGEEENPDRCNDDFVLCFRRGTAAWLFSAGSRARLAAPPALRTKAVPDSSERRGLRRMFWVACVQSRTDRKHYVVVGTVPGLLTEHVFVAKVGRAEPFSHAGFSYLPEPGRVAFGLREDYERAPVVIESITVYPHGLTGELPFVSLRFVEEHNPVHRSEASKVGSEKVVDDAIAVKKEVKEEVPPMLARALLKRKGDHELRILRHPISMEATGSVPNTHGGAATPGPRGSSWSLEARRECGLLSAKDALTPEERLERRAKRRVEVPVMASNFLDAPASWEPCTVDEPSYGPFDDTLRHDPLRLDPYSQFDV